MHLVNKTPDWRIGYIVFCLVYAVWVIYLAIDNFDKVHGEYRRAQEHLQPAQIEKIALQGLVDQCRREAKRSSRFQTAGDTIPGVSEDTCRSFPETVLAERKTVVTEDLVTEEKRFRRKLVVFYVSFGVFFVVLPLVSLYLLLSFFIWLFRDLKFVK